jgi:elongation factor Ts
MVKELREKTGAAMMDCKRALVQAGGDFEKACEVLRQEGIAVASKKSSRTASEGLVVGKVAEDSKSAVILEVNCETDFVARNEEFMNLTKKLVNLALKVKANTVEQFLKAKADDSTVEALISQAIAKTGENIVIRRISFFELGNKSGLFGLYIHSLGGKIGALVKFETTTPVNNDNFGREVAMHVVFAKPQYLNKEQVPASLVENEKRIESGKADLADKKAEIREKIIAGRLDKLIAERCLLEQPFVKDAALTVGKYIQEQAKELKTDIKATDYSLMILGESEPAEPGQPIAEGATTPNTADPSKVALSAE